MPSALHSEDIMQIQLNQSDIETAVRNYVSAMGITRQIDEIQFSVSRKGGQSIEAEIDLADCTGRNKAHTAASEAVAAEPVAESPTTPEPEESVAKASESTESTPFRTEDASNDDNAEKEEDTSTDTDDAAEGGKSLFS